MRKVACITGGSHGIGRGMAIALGKAGYAVAFTYYENKDEAIEVQQTLSALGVRCAYYQAKTEDITAAERLISRVRKEFGQIGVMICNGAMDRRMSILTVTPEQMQFMTTQLYISQILCASRAAQWMVKDGIAGSILFTSSVRAQRADTSDFLYGGMKAALERSCQSLALELAPYGTRQLHCSRLYRHVRRSGDATVQPGAAGRYGPHGGYWGGGGIPCVRSGSLSCGRLPASSCKRRQLQRKQYVSSFIRAALAGPLFRCEAIYALRSPDAGTSANALWQ